MIVAFSISPTGGDETGGVSEAVAEAVRVVRASGLPCETNAMFTNVEGEWDEVMIRGTFANIRLRNQIAPGTEGGFTRDFTAGEGADAPVKTIFEASESYLEQGIPLVILAGKEYGSGSSRDWAAKGTVLLGVKAVVAESYERIHRSNLLMMGVLPLQFPAGESADSLGLTGEETFEITGITEMNDGKTPRTVRVKAGDKEFDAVIRIDTPGEAGYYRHGGIMQYVLRNLRNS